jgi:hypothetical protein
MRRMRNDKPSVPAQPPWCIHGLNLGRNFMSKSGNRKVFLAGCSVLAALSVSSLAWAQSGLQYAVVHDAYGAIVGQTMGEGLSPNGGESIVNLTGTPVAPGFVSPAASQVNFMIDGTSACSNMTMASTTSGSYAGTCSIPLSLLPTANGEHQITFNYGVNQTSLVGVISSYPTFVGFNYNPTTVGQPVAAAAYLRLPAGTSPAVGSVTFTLDGNMACTSVLWGPVTVYGPDIYVATCIVTPSAVAGPHWVRTFFLGQQTGVAVLNVLDDVTAITWNNLPPSAGTVSSGFTGNASSGIAPSSLRDGSIKLSSNFPNNSTLFGQPVILRVQPSSAGEVPPGFVEFAIDGATVCRSLFGQMAANTDPSLSVCAIPQDKLGIGDHTVVASYGDRTAQMTLTVTSSDTIFDNGFES